MQAAHTLVDTMRALVVRGLTTGTAGNASVRTGNGMLITPSGVEPEQLKPDSMVSMSLAGVTDDGPLKPSSEWQLHAAVYASRPDVDAIVHCHSRYATALACLHQAIPAFHYMIAVAGGDSIRCAPYATFGTEALATNALAALTDRKACLLGNHGQIACGSDLNDALNVATEVEVLAAQYIIALQTGTPILLERDEMDRVIAKFSHYGQPQARADD